jgi:hypothetical protein
MKRVFLSGVLPGAAALILAGHAGDASAESYKLTAISGRELHVVFVAELNPDCTLAGESVVRVVASPSHGALRVRKEQGFASYADDNPRHVCNDRRVSGVSVYYTPERSYVGPDKMTLNYVFSNGGEQNDDFALTVE